MPDLTDTILLRQETKELKNQIQRLQKKVTNLQETNKKLMDIQFQELKRLTEAIEGKK